MTLMLRNEQDHDIDAIFELTRAAFLAEEHSSHTEQFIVNALRRSRQLTLSIVARDGERLVGHIAASPVLISTGAAGWHGIGPVSVHPERQGQGIGSLLMKQALTALRELGSQGCVVLGDPGYYARFGFQPQPGLILPGVPAEYFMAQSFGAPLPSGIVSYHPAFEATA
ncbi:N-acetyltransferase [Chromobacterium alkanivorans]|uniref:GNAT family N-acetyltransferase n=1 Tax=Chromobacterium TaxID=535 RepID=UPI00065433A9|nr:MULTISPECIES: N-acetyltransferase [Chromobacterium]KMN77776.1 GCN5 family acetyltransferase [Chromobacterium sp. LK11]MBN3004728.1 N-acetyltransferase [Chromobacterium alkanivorans]